jgi:polyhydroxybutyrate depolymerase
MSAHSRPLLPLLLSLLLLPVAACSDDDPTPVPSSSAAIDTSATGEQTVRLGDRPFRLYVPTSYDAAQPLPLVLGLHGFTSRSAELNLYFGLSNEAEERGFLLALPDGTADSSGRQFWNATDFCCDLGHSNVDDSAYLSELISLVEQSYEVSAVFLIGHSNGGFMSHRMACEHADQVTAIATLAGVLWTDPGRCTPSQAVSVLHMHGTADATIAYAGASGYPSAEETVARWRSMDGCTEVADTTAPARDLDGIATGDETTVVTYADGCHDGVTVQLWRMVGSRHVPAPTADFTPAILDFLYASAGIS